MPLFGPFVRRSTASPAGWPKTPTEPDDTHALAAAITSAGMAGPASITLRIMKPISWIGGQFLWILEPLLGTLGVRNTRNLFSLPGLALLLEREDSIDDLISRLDSRLDNASNDRRA